MVAPQRISFAREKSDAVALRDGTYVPKDRRELRQQRMQEDRQRHEEAERRKREKPSPAANAANAADTSAPPNKILFVQGLPEDASESQLSMLFGQFPGYALRLIALACRCLCAQRRILGIASLLRYKETRMVAAKPGIAFVEYESEAQAGEALKGTDTFQLDSDHTMSVTYAKKAQS